MTAHVHALEVDPQETCPACETEHRELCAILPGRPTEQLDAAIRDVDHTAMTHRQRAAAYRRAVRERGV